MQQWNRWLLALTGACGVLLVIGSIWCITQAGRPTIGRAEAAVAAKGRASTWPLWSNPGTKIVPIVSAGTPGLRLGLAQVTGPKVMVTRVQAVLQIDGDFKSVRAKIMVPSDSFTSLRRVQGTAVTAVLQYKLLGFSSNKSAKPAPQAQRNNASTQCKKPKHADNGKHKGWYKHGKKKCR